MLIINSYFCRITETVVFSAVESENNPNTVRHEGGGTASPQQSQQNTKQTQQSVLSSRLEVCCCGAGRRSETVTSAQSAFKGCRMNLNLKTGHGFIISVPLWLENKTSKRLQVTNKMGAGDAERRK